MIVGDAPGSVKEGAGTGGPRGWPNLSYRRFPVSRLSGLVNWPLTSSS